MNEQTQSPLLSVEAALLYLNISSATLARLRKTNSGPTYIKLGRRVLYRQSDLDAYINSNTIKGESNE